MSYPLVASAACVAPVCTDKARTEVPYDRRMGVCFQQLLGVSITDATEFNSQPPHYYMTQTGVLAASRGARRTARPARTAAH